MTKDQTDMCVKHYKECVKCLAELAGLSPFERAIAMERPRYFLAKYRVAENYRIVLTDNGHKRISVIKEIRAITGLGLKEAKHLSDKVPCEVFTTKTMSEAKDIRAEFEAIGAKVIIR